MAKTLIGNVKGPPGVTPHIGENGNWWIGETDTGVAATAGAEAAEAAAAAAKKSETNAGNSATAAAASEQSASTNAGYAEMEASKAMRAADAAEDAQEAAETAQAAAKAAKADAETAKADAETAKTDAEAAKDDAEAAKESAEEARSAAENAELGAENARTAAASSASKAATSETNAASSAAAAQKCLETVETKLANGEFDGAPGQRGTGILKVTTAPSSYTTAIYDYTPKYRIALSTVKAQAKVDEVLLGDLIQYSYYQYLVDYMDATYAYTSVTRTSLRGANGETPVRGTDYWTPADKAEMVDELTEEAAPVSYNAQNLTPAQQAQARSNIGAFGQNSLTLGVHTDGLIYLFVDGAPVGNGIEQSTGVSGDVVGYVDENNNIVLTGELPEGAVYNVKYEMADGSTVNIGELSLVQAVEIINQIPISTDASGNLFVGTNGEKGYKTGFRISGSSGNESAQTGTEVTGFIPVKYADKVYMKGITDDGTHVIGVYKSDHSMFATAGITQVCGGAINGEVVSFTIDTHFGSGTITSSSGVAFIRVSANEITADSIITVNQAIE